MTSPNRRLLIAIAPSLLCGACASSPARQAPAPAPARGPAADTVEEGVALYEEGRYAEAEAALASVSGVRASAYLAASRVKLRHYAAAEAPAREALQASPAHPVAAPALGEALVSQGKLDEAIQRLSGAIGADPRLALAYYWRGQAYQRRKQVARMVDDYRAFLRLAPDAPEAPAVRALLESVR